jgi:hypothetical protein
MELVFTRATTAVGPATTTVAILSSFGAPVFFALAIPIPVSAAVVISGVHGFLFILLVLWVLSAFVPLMSAIVQPTGVLELFVLFLFIWVRVSLHIFFNDY